MEPFTIPQKPKKNVVNFESSRKQKARLLELYKNHRSVSPEFDCLPIISEFAAEVLEWLDKAERRNPNVPKLNLDQRKTLTTFHSEELYKVFLKPQENNQEEALHRLSNLCRNISYLLFGIQAWKSYRLNHQTTQNGEGQPSENITMPKVCLGFAVDRIANHISVLIRESQTYPSVCLIINANFNMIHDIIDTGLATVWELGSDSEPAALLIKLSTAKNSLSNYSKQSIL